MDEHLGKGGDRRDAGGGEAHDRALVSDVMRELSASCEARFQRAQMVKSFDELLGCVLADPVRHVRSAARYVLDAVHHFGYEDHKVAGETVRRYRIFDAPASGGKGAVHGQERVQAELVKRLTTFVEKGRIDKLLMLHGPNGSGKSTTAEVLVAGVEAYSHTTEGALYRFNWLFSEAIDKARLGFGEDGKARRTDTYAYLEPEEISSRIPCELKCNPIFLVPVEERAELLRRAFARHGLAKEAIPRHILEDDLCQPCREIYQTLLNAYQGDWSRVVQHVQVERFFVSKRYRQGIAAIEPQRNVDAASRPIHTDGRKSLPTVLQNATLQEPSGPLVEGNRGLVEYSDFFKRPLELNKYLLTTIEKNTISLNGLIAYLDVVLIATANEKNLGLAKRDPDFSSFKGRFELISVPYLLEVSKEERIYRDYIDSLRREKHVSPHTGAVAALWGVLTRLKRPRAKNYAGSLGTLVARLSPLEKARLYDRGEAPAQLSDQERRELLAALPRIRQEFDDSEEEFEGLLDAAHEGRRGASPREMLSLLADAAANREFPCLSPQAVIRALRELIKDVSVHDFLRLAPQAGYNDAPRLVDDCELEAARLIREDIQDALDLVSAAAYERLFEDYFVHVRAYVRGERVKNPQSGELEPPDLKLMGRVEAAIDRGADPEELRRGLVTRIAVWSIDHPGQKIETRVVFADIFRALKNEAYKERGKQIDALLRNALTHGTDDFQLLRPSEQKQVEQIVERMIGRGYCARCAKEAIATWLQHR